MDGSVMVRYCTGMAADSGFEISFRNEHGISNVLQVIRRVRLRKAEHAHQYSSQKHFMEVSKETPLRKSAPSILVTNVPCTPIEVSKTGTNVPCTGGNVLPYSSPRNLELTVLLGCTRKAQFLKNGGTVRPL